MLKTQIRVLGIGCFVLSVLNVVMWVIMDFIVPHDSFYTCIKNTFYQPNNAGGAIINFLDIIIDFTGTVLCWYVLYFMPQQYGKVARLRV